MKTKIILIIVISSIIICMLVQKYGKNSKKENTYNTEKTSINESAKNENKEYNTIKSIENDINEKNSQEREYIKEEIINTYKGFKVCAKLEIPKISLETYILSEYSTEALLTSVTKFWGVGPNEDGNFCVAGHNFIAKNMFHNLKDLELGDTFYITDNIVGKVEYEIFKIETVKPEDTSCLDAETDKEKEVTLITCTRDSKKRIIIKAREREVE